MKNDVNVRVPSKSNKPKNLKKKIVSWHLEGRWRKEQDLEPEPDSLVSSRDPRIRIYSKMSRIRKTAEGYRLPIYVIYVLYN